MKNYKYFYFFLAVTFFQFVAAPNATGQFTEKQFNKMANKMAKGKVKDIQVDELKETKDQYILLDAREKQEYDISHIDGAIWVGYDDFNLDRLADISKEAKVVTYCSVGYRSERIGEKLQKAGFSNVQNLHGSIFKWMNKGYPVVDKDNKETKVVHGFNTDWGKWVKNGEVVY